MDGYERRRCHERHVVVGDLAINQRVLEAARRRLEALGIGHITMQIEQERICNEMAHV